jgi:hypothetical protein
MKKAKIKMANAKPLETFLSTMEKFYEEKKKRIYQLNEIAVYGDLKLESTLTFEEYEHNEKFKVNYYLLLYFYVFLIFFVANK